MERDVTALVVALPVVAGVGGGVGTGGCDGVLANNGAPA